MWCAAEDPDSGSIAVSCNVLQKFDNPDSGAMFMFGLMCCRSTWWFWFRGSVAVWCIMLQKFDDPSGAMLMFDVMCCRSIWWSWFGDSVKEAAVWQSLMWWPLPPWWRHPNSLPSSGEMLTPQVTHFASSFLGGRGGGGTSYDPALMWFTFWVLVHHYCLIPGRVQQKFACTDNVTGYTMMGWGTWCARLQCSCRIHLYEPS